MAVRTAAAAALDADVAQLLIDLETYISLQQNDSPGDNPAKLFWVSLVGRLRDLSPVMAQAVDTSSMLDAGAWGKTLSQIDGFA